MFLASVALVQDARAARPMLTDDARVVDAKSCQVESWARRNADSMEYWLLPACSIASNTELTLGGALGHDPSGTQTTDAVVQLKHLFRPVSADQWGAGITLGHVAHPAVNERSNLLGDVYASLLASFPLRGEAVTMHVNLGWLHQHERSAERLTWGLGFEAQVHPRWALIGESFGQNTGNPWWQAGLRYWLVPGRVQIDATTGDRWGSSHGAHWFSIGVRLLSPAFLP